MQFELNQYWVFMTMILYLESICTLLKANVFKQNLINVIDIPCLPNELAPAPLLLNELNSMWDWREFSAHIPCRHSFIFLRFVMGYA